MTKIKKMRKRTIQTAALMASVSGAPTASAPAPAAVVNGRRKAKLKRWCHQVSVLPVSTQLDASSLLSSYPAKMCALPFMTPTQLGGRTGWRPWDMSQQVGEAAARRNEDRKMRKNPSEEKMPILEPWLMF